MEEQSPRQCPVCQEEMDIETIEDVEIDVCVDHGVWLDNGELARLATIKKSREKREKTEDEEMDEAIRAMKPLSPRRRRNQRKRQERRENELRQRFVYHSALWL